MKTELSALFEYADIEGHEAFSQQTLQSTAFQALPFVARATTPEIISCVGCHEACMKQIRKREGKTFICCDEPPSLGYIDLQPEDLNYWKVDIAALAKELAVNLGFSKITELIKNRVYDIGVIENNTLFLVRGIGWDDAGNILNDSRICNSNPLLITLSTPPADISFPALWIGQLINFSDGELIVDRARLDIALNIKPTNNANIFRQSGKQWQIRYDGKEIIMPDSKGLHYIQYLLLRHNKEVAAIELQCLRNKPTENISTEYYLSLSNYGDKVFDAKAISQILQRLSCLQTDSNEYAQLQKILKNSTQGGKSKEFTDANEKARQTVQKAIDTAIKNIEKEHSLLGVYFRASIKTGMFCSYNADIPIKWNKI